MGMEKSIECINQSLQNFDLDYIDLMLIHYPGTKGLKQDDPKINKIELKLGRFWSLMQSKDPLYRLDYQTLRRTMSKKYWKYVRLNLGGYYDFCMQNEILMQSYSPFARFDSRLIQHEIMKKIEKDSGIPVNKIILLWHIQKGFFVLPKSVHKERITDNFSIQGYELSDQQMKEIDSIHKEQQTKVCWDPKGIL
eukprot:403358980